SPVLSCPQHPFAPGAGAPTGWGGRFDCRSTALGAKGRAGNSGAAGGRVLLQRSLPVGAPLGAIGAFRQLRRRRRGFAPGAGAPTGEVNGPNRYRTLSSSMSKIRVLCGGMLPAARPP